METEYKKEKGSRWRKTKWWKRILIIGSIGVGMWYFFGDTKEEKEYVTEIVQRGDIQEKVEVNGTVSPETNVELNFQTSGEISAFFVNKGDRVHEGDILAALDSGILGAEIEKTEAGINMIQAEIDEKYAGPSEEEKDISITKIQEVEASILNLIKKQQDMKNIHLKSLSQAEQEVKNAKIFLENIKKEKINLKNSKNIDQKKSEKNLEDTKEKAKKRILSAKDSLYHSLSSAENIIDGDTSHKIYIGIKDVQKKIHVQNTYRVLLSSQEEIEKKYRETKESQSTEEIYSFLQHLEIILNENKIFMDDIFSLLLNSHTGTTLREEQIETFKQEVKNQQQSLLSNINAITDVKKEIENSQIDIEDTNVSSVSQEDISEKNVDSANNALALAEKNLENIKTKNENEIFSLDREIEIQKILLKQTKQNHKKLISPPRNIDVAKLFASLQQQQALWKKARKNEKNTQIYSPINGVITDIQKEVGEYATPAEEVISIATESFQIKVNIPETDIIKVSVGNTVRITLDAFPPDKIFFGKVIQIDPAETIVQGVIYYEAIISLDTDPSPIKSGMTCDTEILTEKKSNILFISPEALHFENDQPFVFILKNEEKQKQKVTIGLEGEYSTEILAGLEEGQRVILYEKE
jgi:RND family efflux transporter MFP subunit